MGWMLSATSRPFYSRRETLYLLYRRLVGLQDRSGRMQKISPLPRFDARTVQPVTSRYKLSQCTIMYSTRQCKMLLKYVRSWFGQSKSFSGHRSVLPRKWSNPCIARHTYTSLWYNICGNKKTSFTLESYSTCVLPTSNGTQHLHCVSSGFLYTDCTNTVTLVLVYWLHQHSDTGSCTLTAPTQWHWFLYTDCTNTVTLVLVYWLYQDSGTGSCILTASTQWHWFLFTDCTKTVTLVLVSWLYQHSDTCSCILTVPRQWHWFLYTDCTNTVTLVQPEVRTHFCTSLHTHWHFHNSDVQSAATIALLKSRNIFNGSWNSSDVANSCSMDLRVMEVTFGAFWDPNVNKCVHNSLSISYPETHKPSPLP
jgi:hypothetical protein